MSKLSLNSISGSDPEYFPDSEEFEIKPLQEHISDGYGRFGANVLVGHGRVTNDSCGSFRGRYGCLNTSAHELALQLQGKKSKDQVYHRAVFKSCHSPACPKCYRSWVKRESGRIEFRLLEAEKHTGFRTEHIVCSVPPERYDLSFASMRALTLRALKARDIVGGVLVYHAFRLNRETGFWFFSPHWHVLGFLEGGYRCRSCVRQFCSSCHLVGNFEHRTRECFKRDGFIVKIAVDNQGRGVAGERRSIGETAKYQLSHASFRADRKRGGVVWWFGLCSYRRMHVKYVPKRACCPLCGERLIKVHYFGSKCFVLDRSSPDFVFESVDDLEENGLVVFEEVPTVDYRGSGA